LIKIYSYNFFFFFCKGKTCLCQQFLQEKFLTDHKETLDEMHSIELSLVDRRIILEILDTAGIDEFPVMRRIAIAHGDAFLILYAVNDAHSFDIAQQMHQLVLEIKGDLATTIPMVIVANKCDIDINRREISRDYAENIVRDQWKTTLVETTCHQRESVLNTFRILLHLANINTTFSPDVTRRSSDPNLSSNKGQRPTNKRQSCTQQ
jgi:small GTP-binding protein